MCVDVGNSDVKITSWFNDSLHHSHSFISSRSFYHITTLPHFKIQLTSQEFALEKQSRRPDTSKQCWSQFLRITVSLYCHQAASGWWIALFKPILGLVPNQNQPSCTSQWGQWVPSTLAAWNLLEVCSGQVAFWCRQRSFSDWPRLHECMKYIYIYIYIYILLEKGRNDRCISISGVYIYIYICCDIWSRMYCGFANLCQTDKMVGMPQLRRHEHKREEGCRHGCPNTESPAESRRSTMYMCIYTYI